MDLEKLTAGSFSDRMQDKFTLSSAPGPLDLETAARTTYDPTHFQPVLFCADSFDSMCEALRDYLLRQSS